MRKILGFILFALVAGPLVFVSLVLTPVNNVVKDSNYWVNRFNSAEVEGLLLALVASAEPGDIEDVVLGDLTFSGEAFGKAFATTIPPELVGIPLRQGLEFFKELGASADTPLPETFTIDLLRFKSVLREVAPEFVKVYAESIPSDPTISMETIISSGDFRVKPEGGSEFEAALLAGTLVFQEIIPDSYVVELGSGTDLRGSIETFKDFLVGFNQSLLVIYVILGISLVLAMFLVGPPLYRVIRYAGLTLLIPSVLIFLGAGALYLSSGPLGNVLLETALQGQAALDGVGANTQVMSAGLLLAQGLVGDLAKLFLYPAGFFILLSVGLFTASSGLKKAHTLAAGEANA